MASCWREFPEGTAAGIKDLAVIELTAQPPATGLYRRLLGTYQGVWPASASMRKAPRNPDPTSGVWIDTNTGFLRAVRAWGNATVWIANAAAAENRGRRHALPASHRRRRHLRRAMGSGLRRRPGSPPRRAGRSRHGNLEPHHRPAGLVRAAPRVARHAGDRPACRGARPRQGGLLSPGILDMIAVKHTPVRPVPRQQLSAEALAGATMAVNVDASSLSPEQKEILRGFTRGGGTLLTGPPGWKDPTAAAGSITLEKAELERLNDIWHDVNSMIGRRNMGVRLFNVSSMLSNYLAAPGGKTAVVHLVNYSDYPVENVAMHYLGDFKHATLITPGAADKSLKYTRPRKAGVSTWIASASAPPSDWTI